MFFVMLIKFIYCIDDLYLYTIANGKNIESILFLSNKIVDDYDFHLEINTTSDNEPITFKKDNNNRLEIMRRIVKTFGIGLYQLDRHSVFIANFQKFGKVKNSPKINFISKFNTKFDFEVKVPKKYLNWTRIFILVEKKILLNYLQKSIEDILNRIELINETGGISEGVNYLENIHREAKKEKEEITDMVNKYYQLLENKCVSEAINLHWDFQEKKSIMEIFNDRITNWCENNLIETTN